MKKLFFALMALVSVMNVNAASLSASKKINEIRAEQSVLQDRAMTSADPVLAMQIMKGIIILDKDIEALIPDLLAERETLRDQALACGNDVVAAMEITRKVIAIDNLLEELGYEEPADDADFDE